MIVAAMAAGILFSSAASADETQRKIQSAIKKVERSIVGVRYTRDVSGLEEITGGRGMGRSGRSFMRTLGGPRLATGVVTNAEGFIAVSADITRDPMQGWWGGERGGSSSSTPAFKDLTVILSNGEEREAMLVGRDTPRNLAFLQLTDPKDIPPISLATKREVTLAEQVIVIAPLSDEESGTRKFLLSRINAIVEGDSPSYSVMDDIGSYDGGIAVTLDGDVIGIIGRPRSGGDDDIITRGIRQFMGGRSGPGLRVIPSFTLEQIFANPPTGLLQKEKEEAEKEKAEPEKKPGKKGEESGDDY